MKSMTEEEFRYWLPTLTVDQLKLYRDLINEEIEETYKNLLEKSNEL